MEQKRTTVHKRGNDAGIAYSPLKVKVVETKFHNIVCGSQNASLSSMDEEQMSW